MAAGPVAFVLGGGGGRGATEVGMLAALLESGITPDLVVGSSVGAVNGALIAADPWTAVRRLVRAWTSSTAEAIDGDSFARRLVRLACTKTHLNSATPCDACSSRSWAVIAFDELKVPLRVVAATSTCPGMGRSAGVVRVGSAAPGSGPRYESVRGVRVGSAVRVGPRRPGRVRGTSRSAASGSGPRYESVRGVRVGSAASDPGT